MKKEDLEELKRDIDIKLATEISRSTVHEMAKQEIAQSQIKTFKIICIIFAITMLICVVSTSICCTQLIRFMDNIVVEEDVTMDAETRDGSGSAINLYGDSNSINADK
jgi:hypothetical protein